MPTRVTSDFLIHDPGAALRRQGTVLLAAGGIVAGVGVAAIVVDHYTWSGYVGQAVTAVLVGIAAGIAGWSSLRRGDRLGPRLIHTRRPAPRPAPPAIRTRVFLRQGSPVGIAPTRVRALVVPTNALPPPRR